MIETLTTPEIEYLLENVEYHDIVTYCTVHKDAIENFTRVLSKKERDRFLMALSERSQYDADAYDTARKEMVRAVYHLRRGTISEADRMELLQPFFPDMTQRYSILLDENIPEPDAMTFERLLANIELFYDSGVMRIFDDWEACTYLDRAYLKRYAADVKGRDAFRCLYANERKNRTVRLIRRYSGKLDKSPECTAELDEYKTEMRDRLNIILLAIYFEQNPRPYDYMDTLELNMYQGLELEMDVEEALDALSLLKGEVNKYMDKAKGRNRFVRFFLSIFRR